MVKEATTRKQRPPVNKDGSMRRKPGKKPSPGDVRTDRLVLRTHPDLMDVLTIRAREKGLTRSAYVEQLLVGWVRLDPRNRRIDMIGKYVQDAPDPEDVKKRSPLSFAERWQKFSSASQLLLGAPPPSDWFDDGGYGVGPEVDHDVHRRPAEDDQPTPPFRRKR
jgi:hypothetical protein